MAFFAYNLLLLLASPALLPYALYRGWKRGQPWRRIRERLGILPSLFHQTASDSIWLHAVSVGEVTSCGQLVRELRRRFPAAPVFVSTTTATGQQMALEKLAGKVDGIFYAPLDLAFIVRRVLRRLRPRLVIVAETEIWPNLFRETKRAGAGLLLVNGRISDQSAGSYRRFRFFFRHVLLYPDRILAQSATDRERFIAAGAPAETVTVGGNLKYDFEPVEAELPPELADFLARVRPEPLLLAGSTREDEEEPVVEAFRLVAQSKPRALLVVAPRHPQRFDEAARVLAAAGIPYLRRSELHAAKPADLPLPGVLLLDSLGELASLYRMAHVVFVGGSLNGWGGHNVLEPALYGRPVVVGPHMQNFRAIAEALLSNGGMVQVAGAAQLGPALIRLMENPAAAGELGERGRKLAEAQRGATEKAAEECAHLFDKGIPRSSPALGRLLLLAGPALAWEAAARLRLAAYARGWLVPRRLSAFTVCVGNLTAGGAGKTPLVAWLVERLSRAGCAPAVLTRGYGRSSSETLLLHPGDDAAPAKCGDEAAVLLRHFARLGFDAPVGIGANRYETGQQLLSAHSATGTGPAGAAAPDVLVLDDGFQHLALERDADLVLIDVTNPFGGGRMLPLGRLREPLTSLRRADAIVLTRTDPGRRYDELERRLRALNPHAPLFRSWTQPAGVVRVGCDTESPPAKLAGLRIAAFCGLGNPESFWRVLRQQGWNVVARFAFGDHHRYSPDDLRRIADGAAASKADLLLTTEKDVVNLIHLLEGPRAASPKGGQPWARQFQDLHWLKIETVVEQGDELLRWVEGRMAERGRERPSAKQARVQVRA